MISGRNLFLAATGSLLIVAVVWTVASQRYATGRAIGKDDLAVSVESARAKLDDVPIYLTGLGTVQPFSSVLVRARRRSAR